MGNPDAAADIGDLYAWHTDGGTLVVVVTYAGYAAPAIDATYDADVLYEVHLDRDGDAVADATIDVRFGQNAAGDWGVRAMAIPGESEPVVGAIDTVISGAGGAQLWAGQRDDPFFFDLEGFEVTLMTSDLSFDATRDFAAFQNTNAIVIEMPLDAALGTASTIDVWATTARRGA